MDRKTTSLQEMVLRRAMERVAQQTQKFPERAVAVAPPQPPAQRPGGNLTPRQSTLLAAMLGDKAGMIGAAGKQPGFRTPIMGQPVASRADLMAQQDPVYAQQDPFPDPPPGWGSPEEWQSLAPEEKAAIWEGYDGVNPQYVSRPDLRTRGVAGRPDLQTRQYMADPNAPVQPPVSSPTTTSMVRPDVVGGNEIEQRDTTQPPPGWSEGPEDDAYWARLDKNGKEGAWEMYLRAQRQQAPVDITGGEQDAGTTVVGDVAGGAWGGFSKVVEDIRESPPGEFVEEDIVDPVLKAAGYLEHENQKQVADATYHMMTHEGEMPSDWTDPGTYMAKWLGGGVDADTTAPPPGFPGGFELWADIPDDMREHIWANESSGNALAQATVLTYLQGHEELWPAAKAAYEAGGADGLLTWYQSEVGPWWSFASSVLLDPLNIALLLGGPAKALKSAAAARRVGPGTEVSRAANTLDTAGDVIKFLSDPLSGIVERGWGVGRKITGKVPLGRGAAETRAGELIDEDIQTIQAGQGTEAEANRIRAANAQRNINEATAARVVPEVGPTVAQTRKGRVASRARAAERAAPETQVVDEGLAQVEAAQPAITPSGAPEPIAVDVIENGKTVTKSYYDPSYSTPENPNLARVVAEQYAPTNPEAAARFFDDYVPRAKAQMAFDAELREAQIQRGMRGAGTETVERTMARMSFNQQSDALFQLHFGERPPTRVYRQHDIDGGMNEANPLSLIEHAMLGDDAADTLRAIEAIRTFRRPILRGQSNEAIARRMEQRYTELTGEQIPVSGAPTLPPSQAEAGGVLARAQEVSREPLTPPTITDDMRARISDPDEAVSRRAARAAHQTPGMTKAQHAEIDSLRRAAGHPQTPRAPRQRKPPGAVGIVPNPVDDLSNAVEGVKNALGRKLPTPIADEAPANLNLPPRQIKVGKGMVRGDVKHWAELERRYQAGEITEPQAIRMTEPKTITVKRDGIDTQVVTNEWDYYHDTRNKLLDSPKMRELSARQTPEAAQELIDELDHIANASRAKVVKELGPQTPKGKQGLIVRGGHGFFGFNRKAIMFNIFSGPKAIFYDNIGNFIRSVLTGNIEALKHVPRSQFVIMKDHLDEVDLLVHPLYSTVKESGVKALPRDLMHTIGREEVERGLGKGARTWKSMLNPVSNYFVRSVRNAGDNGFRYAIYLGRFERELPSEMGKFLNFVRSKMAKGGVPQDMWDQVQTLVSDAYKRGGSFSPEDIRAITKQFVTDDSFARTWAKQVDDLSMRANKAQLTAMFSYKKTVVDDALSKVFLFHYFMTRSSALYVKLMLQHPQLITYEAALWEYTENQRKQFAGAPDWMEGFIGFGLDDGHALFMDPTMIISGIGVFQALGDGGFNKSRLEAGLNGTGLIMNPLVRTAAATTGWFTTQNPFGTQQLERAVRTLIDTVRYSEFGKERGWDTKFNEGMPLENFTMDLVNGIVDYTNEKFREFGAPIKDFEATSGETQVQNQVRQILITNAEEEGWDEERLIEAQHSLLMGQPNEDVQDAIDEWVGIEGDRATWGLIAPGAQVRDAATDERRAREEAAADVPYEQRTPAEQADADQRSLAQTKSPEALDLEAGMQEYNAAGTDVEQSIADGRSQIIFNYDEVPDHYAMEINGRIVTGAELKAMTDDERAELFDEWAGQYGRKNVIGAYGEGEPLSRYDAARDVIEQAEPVVGDYTEYRKYILTMSEEDKTRYRSELYAVGDTEFRRAHDDQREFQMGNGYAGDELEERMNQWLSDEGAYLALLGIQYKSPREPGPATFNAVDVPPWRETEKEGGGFSDEDDAPKDLLPGALEDVGDFVNYRMKEEFKDWRYPYRRPKSQQSGTTYPGMMLDYLLKT